jgi:ketosteroid isomerase-like protein
VEKGYSVMKRRNVFSIVGTCLAVVLAAGGANCATDEALVRELNELGARLDRAMVDGDFEGVLSFYADDAVLMPNGEATLVGRAAIRTRMEANRAAGIEFESFTGRVEEAWECGGLVYARATYALAASAPGVERPVADKGKSFSVWRRSTDGRLSVVLDIWNTDVPFGK